MSTKVQQPPFNHMVANLGGVMIKLRKDERSYVNSMRITLHCRLLTNHFIFYEYCIVFLNYLNRRFSNSGILVEKIYSNSKYKKYE